MSSDFLLLKKVKSAFYEATKAGYKFNGWSDTQIASDMYSFNLALEGESFPSVLAAVQQMQSAAL